MTSKEIVMLRDKTFCEDCKTGKEKSWASYFLDDGIMVTSGNTENIIGKANIEQRMKSTFALPQLDFTWQPLQCEISDDHTLAVTRGTSRISYMKDGKKVINHGNYTTIWKYVNNNWYISWDIGN